MGGGSAALVVMKNAERTWAAQSRIGRTRSRLSCGGRGGRGAGDVEEDCAVDVRQLHARYKSRLCKMDEMLK